MNIHQHLSETVSLITNPETKPFEVVRTSLTMKKRLHSDGIKLKFVHTTTEVHVHTTAFYRNNGCWLDGATKVSMNLTSVCAYRHTPSYTLSITVHHNRVCVHVFSVIVWTDFSLIPSLWGYFGQEMVGNAQVSSLLYRNKRMCVCTK